jgi:glycosyltransferase involved in cell wall biosynthesis
MSRLRILLLAPDCDPDGISIPYVAYCHAAALARAHHVTVVARSAAAARLRRRADPFCAVEEIATPLLDRLFDWCFRNLLGGNFDTQMRTALSYPFALAFEWRAWRRLRGRIRAGEFDVVLRLLPMSPAIPSPFAFFLRRGTVPFVIGPLNGGLRSAPGFSQPDDKPKIAWAVRRVALRSLPFARSTYRNASAIMIASYHMRREFAPYSEKLFFLPENGIEASACAGTGRPSGARGPLEVIFVGGLVPRKACYVGIRAAAPLLRSGRAHFTIIGDGPERGRLGTLADSLGVGQSVEFLGWLGHEEVLRRLRCADVALLPAVREGGGGVVFEALASGAVPVVLDHGGPGDIVNPGVGYKVSATAEEEVVASMTGILEQLAADGALLQPLRENGLAYARQWLTWDAKARISASVMMWATGKGPKPDLSPAAMHRTVTAPQPSPSD